MNNDKYAKYSNGTVRYGSNGAYHTSDVKHGGQDSGSGCGKYLFAALLIIALLFGSKVIKAHALETAVPTGYLSWNNPTGQAESTGKHVSYVYITRHGNTGMLVYTPLPEIDYPVNVGVAVEKVRKFKHNDEDTTVVPAVAVINEPVQNDEPVTVEPTDEPEDNNDKCNSGRGNGSEDTDGDGQDDDPGNSEEHNKGGD